MIILVCGAPGTGKTTYSSFLAEKLRLQNISVGELLRSEAQNDYLLAATISSGQLADELKVNEVLFKKLGEIGSNFVLDGYPRTLSQANDFKKFLQTKGWKVDALLHLNVSVDTVMKRLTYRGRSDDTPDGIKRRLTIYDTETKGVIHYLEGLGTPVLEVNNTPAIEEVKLEIDAALGKLKS